MQNFTSLKQLTISRINFFIFVVGLLSAIFVSIAYFFSTVDTALLFNSDTMYLPMLFDDVFKNGGNFFSWYLTPAPGFFPDMLLFFMVRTFIDETFYTFLFYSVFQVLLAYIAGLFVIQNFKLDSEKHQAYVVYCTIFLFAIAVFVTKDAVPYVHILLPIFRFGAIFNTLILTSLVFSFFNDRKFLSGLGIFLIVSVGTASDLMFLPMAVVPAIFAIIFSLAKRSSNYFRKLDCSLFLFIAFGTFAGLLIRDSLISNDTAAQYIGLGHSSFLSQVKLLAVSMYEAISSSFPMGVVLSLFYFSIVAQFFKFKSSEYLNQSEAYILAFLIVSPLLASVTVLANGILYGSIHDNRYISNFYWQPIFFSWLAFRKFSISARILKIVVTALVTLSLFQIFSVGNLQTNYYPASIGCVDRVIEDYQNRMNENLSKGISPYWEAKLFSHFSKEKISILQVLPDLKPFLWVNSSDWYSDTDYDFAIYLNNETDYSLSNENLIVSINGEPEVRKTCPRISYFHDSFSKRDYINVLVYGPKLLATQPFGLKRPKMTLKGCRFLSNIGFPRDEDCAMISSSNSAEGYLTFGPYVDAPAGKYKVDLEYMSSDQTDQILGEWDVAVSIDGELKVIYSDSLEAEENSVKKTAFVDIPEDIDPNSLQVRTKSEGVASLAVKEVVIERIQ